jgi:putative ABC transport system ATP-binding protein
MNTSGAEKAIIELKDIKKVYRSKGISYEAIKGISVKIMANEFTAIVGPSGSGKTTLLDMMGTLDSPTNGKVIIDGVDVSKLSDADVSKLRNEKIGFIFQSYNLVPYLSALQNVMLPLMVDNRHTPEKEEYAKQMLEEIGIPYYGKKPTELSGGEQQRVAIVRALVNKPDIILADEPTGNLDTKTTKNTINMMLRVSKEHKTTIVMVTHDPELAGFFERRIHIKDGLIEKEERGGKKWIRD